MLLALNNFINNQFITKSRDDRLLDMSSGQASKPYSKIGIHLVLINCKVINIFRGDSPNFVKYIALGDR